MTTVACFLSVALGAQTAVFVVYARWAGLQAREERRQLLDMRLANPQTQFVQSSAPRVVATPEPPRDLAALGSIGKILHAAPEQEKA